MSRSVSIQRHQQAFPGFEGDGGGGVGVGVAGAGAFAVEQCGEDDGAGSAVCDGGLRAEVEQDLEVAAVAFGESGAAVAEDGAVGFDVGDSSGV